MLTDSEISMFMGAIMALLPAKPKAIASPLDNPASKDADKDQPEDVGSRSVPFSKDIVDDKPESSTKSIFSPGNSQEQVLVKASSHVRSLAKNSGSISSASVAKRPIGGQPDDTGSKNSPQNGSGRLSARIDSWRAESAIIKGKQHSDGPISDTARQQDLRTEPQNTTDAHVGYIKRVNEHIVKDDVERESQSSATTPKGHKKIETRASTRTSATANTPMEIWVIHPTHDERAPRAWDSHTGKSLPLEQDEIKRSFRRFCRWRRVDCVKQYANLWPEERYAIDDSIFRDLSTSAERTILAIIVQKMPLWREPIANKPQRQLLVFTRRYILDVPDFVERYPQLPPRVIEAQPRRVNNNRWDEPLADQQNRNKIGSMPQKHWYHTHGAFPNDEPRPPGRGRIHSDESRTPSPVDPKLRLQSQQSANLQRNVEYWGIPRLNDEDEDAEATQKVAAKQKIADEIAEAAGRAAAAATKEGEYQRLYIYRQRQIYCYSVADVSVLHSGNENNRNFSESKRRGRSCRCSS